ncbi:DUF418 domain-containing protein [Paenibacillus wenxiniae]|uniref:DUF418 domain-containing protein n=1 Tax=Paenibacillus wenxiniae TaxID=1636843 RepID=A0ABW4RM07_9BACL
MNTSSTRLQLIDAMRGFSLLGIILANMLIFQYGSWGLIDIQATSFSRLDHMVNGLLEVLVVGSFMPIFALLFGFGIVKMKESLERRHLSPYTHLGRRFALLMVIGMVHAFFIWDGDILTYYGAFGFGLLLYLRCRPNTLLVWTSLGFGVLLLIGLVSLIVPDSGSDTADNAYLMNMLSVYSQGSYLDIVLHRNTETPFGSFAFSFVLMFLLLFSTSLLYIPLFWLGMYMAKKGVFEQANTKKSLYMRGTLLFVPIGLALKLTPLIIPVLEWETLAVLFGGPVLAIGYVFAFAWIYVAVGERRWMNHFTAVGKLSLTNYLLQSVLATTLFYGYGFGWFGQLGVTMGAVIALGIYVLQWLLSPLYLRRYSYGPVEKLLRMWTNLSRNGQPRAVTPNIHSARTP